MAYYAELLQPKSLELQYLLERGLVVISAIALQDGVRSTDPDIINIELIGRNEIPIIQGSTRHGNLHAKPTEATD